MIEILKYDPMDKGALKGNFRHMNISSKLNNGDTMTREHKAAMEKYFDEMPAEATIVIEAILDELKLTIKSNPERFDTLPPSKPHFYE